MEFRICSSCGKKFRKLTQIREHAYCTDPNCRRERRRLTQKCKRASDPDYKDNQTRAAQAWAKRNPEYSRNYRQSNPEYTERNRKLQKARNDKRKTPMIAKMDLSPPQSPIPSGVYRMTLISSDGIAKMDEWTVEIIHVSGPYRAR